MTTRGEEAFTRLPDGVQRVKAAILLVHPDGSLVTTGWIYSIDWGFSQGSTGTTIGAKYVLASKHDAANGAALWTTYFGGTYDMEQLCGVVEMELRALGMRGMQTSVIGLGTWPMGGEWWGGTDDAEAIRTIHRAIDLGVTLIDTAEAYAHGHAEQVVGRAITRVSPQFLAQSERNASSITPNTARLITACIPHGVGWCRIHWLVSRERYPSTDCAKRRSTALGSCSSNAAIWLACSPG
jgi:hypothetical protein